MTRDSYPRISVIIPAYNSAATVGRAVRSALSQTYPDTEVIVIDDGSEDDTSGAVAEAAGGDSRVRLIRKHNQGVSAARNDGIREAAGEWFITLDADDYIGPGMLSSLYDTAVRDDADTVICGFKNIYDDGRREVFRADRDYSDSMQAFADAMLVELYDRHMISTHSNKLYKTSLVRSRKIFYNEKLAVNEDLDFVLRYLAECGTISVIRAVYLNYVQHGHGESLINTFRDYGTASSLLAACSCLDLLERAEAEPDTASAMERRMFVHICSFIGLMYRYSGYSEERLICELRVLGEQEEFTDLLDGLKPRGLKERAACFLLRHRKYDLYHRLCRHLYGSLPGVSADSAFAGMDPQERSGIILSQCTLPYRRLGFPAHEGGGQSSCPAPERAVTRKDIERLREVLEDRNRQK